MSEIQVTSPTLRSKAEELSNLNEQFRNAVNEMIDQETALRAQYESEASDTFHAEFSKDVAQMNNFYNAIAQYVQKLLTIAENYENAENVNIQTATTRNY